MALLYTENYLYRFIGLYFVVELKELMAILNRVLSKFSSVH
jgi:hypothetical protein